jgi:hypothetical protein
MQSKPKAASKCVSRLHLFSTWFLGPQNMRLQHAGQLITLGEVILGRVHSEVVRVVTVVLLSKHNYFSLVVYPLQFSHGDDFVVHVVEVVPEKCLQVVVR